MRDALKVMPPILIRWPTTSEMDVGDMAVEAEPSCQYCYILLSCDRRQQGGTLDRIASDRGESYEVKVCY